MNPALGLPSRLGAVWPWLAAVATGAMLTACFAPWDQPWLAWIALAPLVAAIWFPGGGSARRGAALGYVAGLVFFWGAFSWLTEVTGIGWFCLAFYMALYPAAWGAFAAAVANAGAGGDRSRYLRSRWNLWFAFLGAAAWTGLEWVRGWMFSGFGWNTLGSSLHANLPFIQIAEWTGAGGLTFLAAFVNLIAVSTVCRFALEIRARRIRPHFDFTLTISAMLGVFAYGFHALQSRPPGETIPLRVAAVQANIPQLQKWDRAFEARIFQVYEQLSQAAIATRPQLLLWPEAATPRGVFADEDNFRFVQKIAAAAASNFLLGSLDYEFAEDGQPLNAYNAAIFLPRQGPWKTYRKMHLVPFGEFVPFRRRFPLFAWIVGEQVPSDFASGTAPAVFQLTEPGVRIAPLICFEDTVGRVARAPVQMGAQVLVNLTNDGWFGHSAACEQQLAESIFRAVENRRPLIRCANTGVTAFISAQGRIERVLRAEDGSSFLAGVLAGEIRAPINPALTFYTRHGELFSTACALAALAAAAAHAGRARAAARRKAAPPLLP